MFKINPNTVAITLTMPIIQLTSTPEHSRNHPYNAAYSAYEHKFRGHHISKLRE